LDIGRWNLDLVRWALPLIDPVATAPGSDLTLDIGLWTLDIGRRTLGFIEGSRGFGQTFSKPLESFGFCEDHIFKWLTGEEIVEFAGAKAIDQCAIVGRAYKCPATNYGEVWSAIDLHWHGETL
jgi:hypothetical protein